MKDSIKILSTKVESDMVESDIPWWVCAISEEDRDYLDKDKEDQLLSAPTTTPTPTAG